MAFKPVELTRTSTVTGNPNPLITVTNSGSLRINKAAQQVFDVDQYQHVAFQVDDESENRIGLELLKDATEKSRALKGESKGNGRTISAGVLIKQYGLKPGSYALAQDEDIATMNSRPLRRI